MDELIELVAQKAHIDEKAAKVAVNTVIDYLQKNIPEPYGSQINALLNMENNDLLSSLSDLMGNK